MAPASMPPTSWSNKAFHALTGVAAHGIGKRVFLAFDEGGGIGGVGAE